MAATLPAQYEIVDVNRADETYRGYPEYGDGQGGFLQYGRILRRRKGALILGAALGVFAAVSLTLPRTPIYKATSTLEIQSLNRNFLNIRSIEQTADNGGWDEMRNLQTQIEILRSRTLVQAVAEDLKKEAVASGIKLPAESSRISAWRRALHLSEAEAPTEQAVSMTVDSLSVRGDGRTRIVEVSADSTDPNVAAAFVNLLTQEYIEQSIDARWESSKQTSVWLDRRLDETRIKLERSETALQDYARQTGLLFTDQDTNVDEAKLEQLQAQLTEIQGDRVARQSRWEMASNASPETLPDVLNDSTLRGYQQNLSDLRKQRRELLETFKPASPPIKRIDAQIDSLEESLDRERQQIVQRIKNEFEESMRKELLIRQAYDEQANIVTNQNEKAIQYGILKREAETNRQLHGAMLERVQEAELASALKANNVRVVDAARPPSFPYKPNLSRNGLVGLFLGSAMAAGILLLRARADRTLKEPGDLHYYVGVPELGIVPSANLDESRKNTASSRKPPSRIANDSGESAQVGATEKFELVTFQRALSVAAESFRAALTSIQFSGNGHGTPSVIVVTSPNPGEGKTTIASNLAISMAETGQRVLLIDGDTRRPRLHDIFEVDSRQGLTALLAERGRDAHELAGWVLEDLVAKTSLENIDVLPAGQKAAGPVNLSRAKHLSAILGLLRNTYDTILIDTPPMMTIPDARLFGKLADGVVLVFRAGSTTRDAALAAKLRLFEDGVHLIGAVMNDWDPRRPSYGSYRQYASLSDYGKGQRRPEWI